MDPEDAQRRLDERPDPDPAMRPEDKLQETRDRLILSLASKGWNTLAGNMAQPVCIVGTAGSLRIELGFTRVDPDAVNVTIHDAENGGWREYPYRRATDLPDPEVVRHVLDRDRV